MSGRLRFGGGFFGMHSVGDATRRKKLKCRKAEKPKSEGQGAYVSAEDFLGDATPSWRSD
jgi:hypothetical protein